MGIIRNGKFIPEWRLKGLRRPLPGIGEAIENYGRDNVYYRKPQYVDDGICPYCGKPVNNKRRTYCTNECRNRFQQITVWNRGRGAYAMQILYRDKFTCQDCGEFHARISEYGIPLPVDDGQLEIHHIIPVHQGGGDQPINLITLCKSCHLNRHIKPRKGTPDTGARMRKDKQ